VEDQAKQAVVGPPSFGMPSYEAAEKRLKEIKGYGPLFKEAFPDDKDPVTVDNFAKAVGAFAKTLVTPSRFDAFVKGLAWSNFYDSLCWNLDFLPCLRIPTLTSPLISVLSGSILNR